MHRIGTSGGIFRKVGCHKLIGGNQMSHLSYVIVALLCRVLASVPLGTNRGLFTLLCALLSERFLPSRGPVFPALMALGLAPPEVRRCEAALATGRFHTAELVSDWHKRVQAEGKLRPH